MDAFLGTLYKPKPKPKPNPPANTHTGYTGDTGTSPGVVPDKMVIASNFTYMLDEVSILIASRGYGSCLRIDGGVSVDKRQGMVDRFNRTSDPNRFFLLSSKAGMTRMCVYDAIVCVCIIYLY